MAIYIFQVIVLTILSIISNYSIHGKKQKEQVQQFVMIFSFFMLSFTMCMRSNLIGSDTYSYSNIYERICNTSSLSQAFQVAKLSAPVYVTFAYILSRFFKFKQAITIASSLIICLMMCKTIKISSKKYSRSILLFVLLTLYYESFNGARQMLSVMFAVYAFWILLDNIKSFKGWALILISVGIHNTGIFFMVAILGIWLSNKSKDNKSLFIKTSILSVISTAFFGIGINLMTRYFPRYLMYINGSNPESILENTGGGRIALLYVFELMIVVSYIVLSKRKDIAMSLSEKKTLPALVFCCICGIVFSKNTLIQRLLWYYEALFVTSIPNMLQMTNKKYRNFIWIIIYSVLLIYSVWFLLENKGHIIPYSFFWEN